MARVAVLVKMMGSYTFPYNSVIAVVSWSGTSGTCRTLKTSLSVMSDLGHAL